LKKDKKVKEKNKNKSNRKSRKSIKILNKQRRHTKTRSVSDLDSIVISMKKNTSRFSPKNNKKKLFDLDDTNTGTYSKQNSVIHSKKNINLDQVPNENINQNLIFSENKTENLNLYSETTQKTLEGSGIKIVEKKNNILIIRETERDRRLSKLAGESQISKLDDEWEDISPNIPDLLEKERIKILEEFLNFGNSNLLTKMNQQILKMFNKMRDEKWTLQNQLDFQRTKSDAYKNKYKVTRSKMD
jgi:hypothetical protein